MIDKEIGYIICESSPVEPAAVVSLKSSDYNGKAVAECILQTADETNRNGRYYAEEELFPQLKAPRTVELLRTGTLRAECGHPLSKDLQRQSTIDDKITCARFLDLWTEGKDIHSHVIGTNNEYGKAFDLDLKEGVLPAWSLRALGSVHQTNRGAEVRNLRLITWDNVIYPSHPGAYTQRVLSEAADVSVNDDAIIDIPQETMTESGIIIPITNESVINYLMSESANLKFLRECFDFAYNNIIVNENGTKVILTTNDGQTIGVNMERYIHNNLMDYHKFEF